MTKSIEALPTWEYLQKKMIWDQLGTLKGKTILDYGSGQGHTSNMLAAHNNVTAIEPCEDMLSTQVKDNSYVQVKGDIQALRDIGTETFDMIVCHNVFEYTQDRPHILKEFSRILKEKGVISIVKHNRAGRVMQMVSLLNKFDRANAVLDGEDGIAQKYGAIMYYTDSDLLKWMPDFEIVKSYGIRTFWALQQNQEIHTDEKWQTQMLAMEHRVSEIDEFRKVASFHHLILERKAL